MHAFRGYSCSEHKLTIKLFSLEYPLGLKLSTQLDKMLPNEGKFSSDSIFVTLQRSTTNPKNDIFAHLLYQDLSLPSTVTEYCFQTSASYKHTRYALNKVVHVE